MACAGRLKFLLRSLRHMNLSSGRISRTALPSGTNASMAEEMQAKSWSFARALVAEAFSQKHLILCTRQFQNSIADSVYRVVENQVRDLKLAPWFEFTRQSIYCKKTGSEFIFKGLDRNINEIRSLEGVTRCWIEEANTTRLDSWLILDPTIRKTGSQIWISYNPERDEDALHKKFVVDTPPPEAFVRKTSGVIIHGLRDRRRAFAALYVAI
jgi:PBSX family phage terminase large subunit